MAGRQVGQDAIGNRLRLLDGEAEGCRSCQLVEIDRAGIHFSPSLREGGYLALHRVVKCKNHCCS